MKKITVQMGFGLLHLIFLLMIASLFAVFHLVTPPQQIQAPYQASRLKQMKTALMGKIFQIEATQFMLGALPSPDRLFSTEYFTDFVTKKKVTRPNYDGTAETECYGQTEETSDTSIGDAVCLGKIPWKELGLPFLTDEQDGYGQVAWFAFSANIMDRKCFFPFNSNTFKARYTHQYICGNAEKTLPYPWLTVRDANGNVLSDQVVFVLIIAGTPLRTQKRTAPPTLATAADYLEQVTIPETCTQPCQAGTYSNADRDNDFIQGSSSATFNDQLIYITLGEYLAFLEKSVLNLAGRAWVNFYQQYGTVPLLIDPTSQQETTASFGRMPFYVIDKPDVFSFETEITWQIQDKLNTKGQKTLKTGLLLGTDIKKVLTASEFEQYYTYQGGQKARCAWTSQRERAAYCQVTILDPKTGIAARRLTLQLDKTTTQVAIQTAPFPTRTLSYSGTATGVLSAEDFIRDPKTNALIGQGGWEITGGQATILIEKIRLYPEMPKWFLQQKWFELLFVTKATQNPCTTHASCLKVMDQEKNKTDFFQFVLILAGAPLAHQMDRDPVAFKETDYFETPTLALIQEGQIGMNKKATADFNDKLKGIK